MVRPDSMVPLHEVYVSAGGFSGAAFSGISVGVIGP